MPRISPMIWDGFFPGADDYEMGNYTVNDIKQSPYGGYVIVGNRNISAANGYTEVMLMRIDEEGRTIDLSAGATHGGINYEDIPWDQEAYDMIITPHYPQLSYLVTGFRDTTLTSASTPPGLLLMEIWGNGSVLFDSLYHNNNLDWSWAAAFSLPLGEDTSLQVRSGKMAADPRRS